MAKTVHLLFKFYLIFTIFFPLFYHCCSVFLILPLEFVFLLMRHLSHFALLFTLVFSLDYDRFFSLPLFCLCLCLRHGIGVFIYFSLLLWDWGRGLPYRKFALPYFGRWALWSIPILLFIDSYIFFLKWKYHYAIIQNPDSCKA